MAAALQLIHCSNSPLRLTLEFSCNYGMDLTENNGLPSNGSTVRLLRLADSWLQNCVCHHVTLLPL